MSWYSACTALAVVMDRRGRRVQVEAPPISDGDYLTAWYMIVLPLVTEFRPDLVLVSAGFDAADKDPLGELSFNQLFLTGWG
eukprot:gene9647-9807_t